MSTPKPIVMLTVDELREIIRGEVNAARPSPMPRFLNVSQCADCGATRRRDYRGYDDRSLAVPTKGWKVRK